MAGKLEHSPMNGLQEKIKEQQFDVIIGQDSTKYQIKSALLTGRHIVLIGAPGIGKTTLAKSVAEILPKEKDEKTGEDKEIFVRVQGSPDLTAEDLIGDIDPIKALKYGPLSVEAFTPGKIFKANGGILFFDEVNRCSEKLQNALLQVLEERIATIGSYDVDIEANFVFIGTMNPEDSSTEKLSDVFMDRFDLVYMTYPASQEEEEEIVQKHGEKIATVPEDMLSTIVGFVRELRENKNLEKHPSVRATLGLYERSQSNALLDGRDTVEMIDMQRAVKSVLAHRIKLKPSLRYLKSPMDFAEEEFSKYVENKSSPVKGGGL